MLSFIEKRYRDDRKAIGNNAYGRFRALNTTNLDREYGALSATSEGVDYSHILMQLLAIPTFGFGSRADTYYDKVDSLSLDMAHALKITTVFDRGSYHTGNFTGDGTKEILFRDTNSNVRGVIGESLKDFNSYIPVRPILYGGLALNYAVPGDYHVPRINEHAIFEIDIPLLLTMYREWVLYYDQFPPEQRKGKSQFINQVVLANMVGSMNDFSFMNRLKQGEWGEFETKPRTISMVMDLHQDLDKVISEYKRKISDNDSAYDVANSIEVPGGFTITEMFPELSKFSSRESRWVGLLLLGYYMEVLGSIGKIDSDYTRGKLKRYMRVMKSGKYMNSSALPNDVWSWDYHRLLDLT